MILRDDCISFSPMKAPRLFGLLFLAVPLSGQVILTDNFNTGSLDSSKWTTSLPFGSSTVVQSGGFATTTGRGILESVIGYSSPYAMSGSFTMNDANEHFDIYFRTDFSVIPSSNNTLTGMFVEFSNDGDQISIQGQGFSPTFSTPSDHKSYSLTTGQSYAFTITDNGTDISVSINGVVELTASTTNATGNKFAFSSREFASTSTSIDAITVTAIPEPGTYGALAGATMMVAAILKRKRSGIVNVAT